MNKRELVDAIAERVGRRRPRRGRRRHPGDDPDRRRQGRKVAITGFGSSRRPTGLPERPATRRRARHQGPRDVGSQVQGRARTSRDLVAGPKKVTARQRRQDRRHGALPPQPSRRPAPSAPAGRGDRGRWPSADAPLGQGERRQGDHRDAVAVDGEVDPLAEPQQPQAARVERRRRRRAARCRRRAARCRSGSSAVERPSPSPAWPTA